MAKQIHATPSTKKISDLYTRLTAESPSLILQPEFQRRFVWTDEHKEKLIDTLLRGLPIPEIYIAQSGIDIQKIWTQEVVVDGQQRLSTIIQYINEDKESKVFGNIVPKFEQLSPEDKRDFLSYDIVIRDLGDLEGNEIIDIFKRINSTRYGLNDVELHNAVYDGKFISTAKEIAKEIELKELPFLTDTKISRMEDINFILLLMSTIVNGGYFTRDKEIEKSIINYNNNFEKKEEIKEKMISIFAYIDKLNLSDDSIWYRKSNYYTLFIEFYNNELRDSEEIIMKLVDFEGNILKSKGQNKSENDYSMYYSYMYTGTNSRQARVRRGEIFSRYIFDK